MELSLAPRPIWKYFNPGKIWVDRPFVVSANRPKCNHESCLCACGKLDAADFLKQALHLDRRKNTILHFNCNDPENWWEGLLRQGETCDKVGLTRLVWLERRCSRSKSFKLATLEDLQHYYALMRTNGHKYVHSCPFIDQLLWQWSTSAEYELGKGCGSVVDFMLCMSMV